MTKTHVPPNKRPPEQAWQVTVNGAAVVYKPYEQLVGSATPGDAAVNTVAAMKAAPVLVLAKAAAPVAQTKAVDETVAVLAQKVPAVAAD